LTSALIDTSAEHAPPTSPALLDVANVMMHVYKGAFERGPTKARAVFSGSDALVVLMEGSLITL
jgi:hypothetical protein